MLQFRWYEVDNSSQPLILSSKVDTPFICSARETNRLIFVTDELLNIWEARWDNLEKKYIFDVKDWKVNSMHGCRLPRIALRRTSFRSQEVTVDKLLRTRANRLGAFAKSRDMLTDTGVVHIVTKSGALDPGFESTYELGLAMGYSQTEVEPEFDYVRVSDIFPTEGFRSVERKDPRTRHSRYDRPWVI